MTRRVPLRPWRLCARLSSFRRITKRRAKYETNTSLIHCHQFAVAMFDGLAGELHSCLSGENETVAENVRPRQPLARLVRRVFGGDGLLGTERDNANVPLAFFFGDEASERANGIFADDVGRGAVILRAAAAPKIDDVAATPLFHERDHVFCA